MLKKIRIWKIDLKNRLKNSLKSIFENYLKKNKFENFSGKHIRELFWKTDMRMVLENKSKNCFDFKDDF